MAAAAAWAACSGARSPRRTRTGNYVVYTLAMRVNVVRIGNSRGLRLPKAILEQCGIGDEVDLVIEDGQLVVRPVRRVREGWAEAARTMAARGDDRLLDAESPTTFDEREWEW